MKLVLTIALCVLAAPAMARKPTALLIDGALMYQAPSLRPLAPLADDLRAQGFRVVMDTHLLARIADEEPVLIVGHSAGGCSAHSYARRMIEEARFHPAIITFDSVCTVCPVASCLNINSPVYPDVSGAKNISALRHGVLTLHALLPTVEKIRSIVLRYSAPLARPMGE